MDKRGGPREPIGHCVVACPRVAMNDPVLDSTLAAFQSPKNQSPEGISRVLRTATWRSRSTSVPSHLVIYNLAARADTSGHVHPSCGSKSFRRAKASVGEMGTGGHVHASTGPLLPGDSVGGAGLTEPGHRTPSRHLAACCLSAGRSFSPSPRRRSIQCRQLLGLSARLVGPQPESRPAGGGDHGQCPLSPCSSS